MKKKDTEDQLQESSTCFLAVQNREQGKHKGKITE